MSSVVKLQGHADWHVYDTGTKTYFPFSFSPLSVQGFSDYQAVYSHFKILKVVMTISRQVIEWDLDKYAVIPSRRSTA